jgi:hypothetical protein
MCDRFRLIVTLLIGLDSPLAKGRLPTAASHEADGIRADFDPVSYGALRASLGEFIPLAEVVEMFSQAARKKRAQGSAAGDEPTQPSENPS